MKIPVIRHDLLQHYFWGGLAGLVGAFAALLLVKFQSIGPAAPSVAIGSIAAAAGVGVIWELWQKYRKTGTPDSMDAFATACGGVPLAVGAMLGSAFA